MISHNDAHSTHHPIDSILSFGAKPCGSRHIIEGAEVENSDYDFFISSEDLNAFKKEFPYFKYTDFVKSMSPTLKIKNYSDLYTLGIFKAEIDGKKIEVTVKECEYIPAITVMWGILKDNPNIYRKKIWKRNNSTELVRQNISNLIEALHIK